MPRPIMNRWSPYDKINETLTKTVNKGLTDMVSELLLYSNSGFCTDPCLLIVGSGNESHICYPDFTYCLALTHRLQRSSDSLGKPITMNQNIRVEILDLMCAGQKAQRRGHICCRR